RRNYRVYLLAMLSERPIPSPEHTARLQERREGLWSRIDFEVDAVKGLRRLIKETTLDDSQYKVQARFTTFVAGIVAKSSAVTQTGFNRLGQFNDAYQKN